MPVFRVEHSVFMYIHYVVCVCVVQSAVKQESGAASGASSRVHSTGRRDSSAELRQDNIARPDTSHMLPFKPSSTSGTCLYIPCYSFYTIKEEPNEQSPH